MSKLEAAVSKENLPDTRWGRNVEGNQTQKQTYSLLGDTG